MKHLDLRIDESLKTLINSRKEHWYHKYTNTDLYNNAWNECERIRKRINTIIWKSEDPSVYGDMSLESKGINEQNLQSLSNRLCLLSTMAKYKQISLDNIDKGLSSLFRYNFEEDDNRPPITLIIVFSLGLIIAILLLIFAGIKGFILNVVLFVVFQFSFVASAFVLYFILSPVICFVINTIVSHKYNDLYLALRVNDSISIGISEIETSQDQSYRNSCRNKISHTDNGYNIIQNHDDVRKDSKIIQRWDLLEFAKIKGKMQVGTFVNKETGESYKTNLFTDNDGNICYVPFSATLGELSASAIIQMKSQLEVIMLENGNYILQRKCKPEIESQGNEKSSSFV